MNCKCLFAGALIAFCLQPSVGPSWVPVVECNTHIIIKAGRSGHVAQHATAVAVLVPVQVALRGLGCLTASSLGKDPGCCLSHIILLCWPIEHHGLCHIKVDDADIIMPLGSHDGSRDAACTLFHSKMPCFGIQSNKQHCLMPCVPALATVADADSIYAHT